MAIDSYLRQIARGARGARDLDRASAHDLFAQVLDRRASDLEIGAFCVAMRVKGESAEELAGFYDALKPRLPLLRATRPAIILPSYNGARKTPLLTPLLARLLSQSGYTVLVHGMHEEARRTGSEAVFAAMNWPIAQDVDAIGHHLQSEGLVYCPVDLLSLELANLLRVRRTLGLRNSAHVIAKLINPFQTRCLQVVNYTHPEYPAVLEAFFGLHPANAISMRGHEGEPVPSPHRLPELIGRIDDCNVATPLLTFDSSILPDTEIGIAATVSLYERVLTGSTCALAALVAFIQTIERIFPADHHSDTV